MFMHSTAILSAVIVATQAHAMDLSDVASVDVLPGWRTDSGTHMAALRVRLAPGWKTYWRAPGEAGIPPRFDWAGSQNIGSVAFHWPTPVVFEQNGVRTIGYKDELVLPIELTPATPGQPIKMLSAVELGICEDICMPVTVQINAILPATGGANPAIRAALADQPSSANRAGVERVTCDAQPISDGLRLTASLTMPALGPSEVAVVELPDESIWVSEADTRRDGARLTAQSDLVPPSAAPFMLDRSEIRITVIADGHAVDIRGCAGP
ncbi:protein-disulfide reductase DsbD domain-containing protein [Aliiroseovarius sp. PTFE2010]|uniref:protein-disulfide reductase DsbD domain-containing protein n=1 Tax=Aliiroseovarius sp. PTFE2010 TaxID=3417190 RepID=UPI003CF64CB2